MSRRPNRNPRTEVITVVHFLPHERKRLHYNLPGPSGQLGGYPRHENWIIDNTDASGNCPMDATRLERTIRYCREYGKGGPNQRIRDACIPALRRIGIDLAAGWRAPRRPTEEPRGFV